MPFTVNDVRDLIQLLEQHPEWRAEVRRLVLTEEVLGLPAVVRELADAQARTEARVEELAAAQLRTEARLEELAKAQARTEARLDELAQAQARTEEQLSALAVRVGQLAEGVERLTGRVERLGKEVGSLSEGVGASVELEGEQALARLLADKGYRLLERLRPVTMNGEVDVVTRVRDSAGQTLPVVLEAKFRLHRGDVAGWHRRLRERAMLARLQLRGIEPPFLAYAFGLRVYEDAEEAGRETGIGILTPAGEIVPPTPLSPVPRGTAPGKQ